MPASALPNTAETSPAEGRTVLRVKRPRTAPAPELLAVEDSAASGAKRPRTSAAAAFARLALAPDGRGTPQNGAGEGLPAATAGGAGDEELRKRYAAFRRLDASTPGARRVIAKGKVVDVAAKLVQVKGKELMGGKGKGKGGGGGDGGAVFTCNGDEMLRESLAEVRGDGRAGGGLGKDTAGGDVGLEDEDCVYDVYVRDSAMVLDVEDADAVLRASDVPDVEFWSGDEADSSDDGGGDCDLDDSEGSVDYPSTPDEDAYEHEVVECDASQSSFSSGEGAVLRDRRFGGCSDDSADEDFYRRADYLSDYSD